MNIRPYLIACLALSACSPGNPEVSSALGNVPAPTNGGLAAWSVAVRNVGSAVVVKGDCDRRAIDLEYSLEGDRWEKASALAGADADCRDGRFQFSLANVFSGTAPGSSATKPLRLRHVFAVGRGADTVVTLEYQAPGAPRNKALRPLVGHISHQDAEIQVELKIYARGTVQ